MQPVTQGDRTSAADVLLSASPSLADLCTCKTLRARYCCDHRRIWCPNLTNRPIRGAGARGSRCALCVSSPGASHLVLCCGTGCLFQDLFEGGRCEIQKPHTQNFATTHSLLLAPGGPQAPSSYDFGATYATNGVHCSHSQNHSLSYWSQLFLRGGVGHTGDMNAMGRVDFSSRLAALLRGQVAMASAQSIGSERCAGGVRDAGADGGA